MPLKSENNLLKREKAVKKRIGSRIERMQTNVIGKILYPVVGCDDISRKLK